MKMSESTKKQSDCARHFTLFRRLFSHYDCEFARTHLCRNVRSVFASYSALPASRLHNLWQKDDEATLQTWDLYQTAKSSRERQVVMNRLKVLAVGMMLGLGAWLASLSVAADEKPSKLGGDPDFAQKASASSMAEVNFSELAVRFTRNPAVKQFAQLMIRDHMRAGQELTQLANARAIRLAPAMDEKHQKLYDKLKTLSGAEFDRAYMDAMVKDHEEAVKLFEAESKDGKDQAMKRWAGKLEPTFKKHLEKARQVNDQIKGEKKNGKEK